MAVVSFASAADALELVMFRRAGCPWCATWDREIGPIYGKTDEIGSAAVERPMHVKHLHATILHQLGLDPDRLTYFYGGLDQKLVGVEGAEPIHELIG